MQNELRSEYPEKPIQIAAINEHGYENGNSLMAEDRSIPILQDVDANNNDSSDVWSDNWGASYRDVKIINQQNELVGTINLTPPLGFDLSDETNYNALKQVIADVANEQPLWQNPDDPTDVNDDKQTSAVDALQCINELMLGKVSGSNVDLPLPMPPLQPTPYLDVNGDGRITANDAIRVINRLIEQSSTTEGESIAAIRLPSVAEGERMREPVSPFATDTLEVNDIRGGQNDGHTIDTSSSQFMSHPKSTSLTSTANGVAPPILHEDAVDRLFCKDHELLPDGSISRLLVDDQSAG
ncbi:MAG: dockerin type I domain-containing protein [Rubripirellula sp.]|nr:dockerin type I domain-containing protein [Rubripirellula sp.]